MSFSAYAGLSGSGKSYNAVEHVIIPALKKGQQVWTNIPLDLDLLEKDFGSKPVQFKTQELKENQRWLIDVLPKGACLVLDEIQMLYPSGTKATAISEPEKEFFTQYRHRVGADGHTTEFVIITQDLQNLASFVRGLVGVTYRHTKLEHIGASNRFNVHIYQGAVTGPSPSERTKTGQTGPHKYRPEIYKYYQSATQSDAGKVGDESRSDNRINIFRNPKFWVGVFAMVLLIGFGSWSVRYVFKSAFGTDELEQQANQVNQVTTDNGVPGEPTRTITRRPAPDPFDSFEIHVYSNIGIYPKIDFKFLIKGDGTRSVLSLQDLRRIGYSVTPISPCMLKLEYEGTSRFAQCIEAGEKEAQPMFDNLI